jgi:hypothetical protein
MLRFGRIAADLGLHESVLRRLPTKGWLQVSQKAMIFDKIMAFCCFSTVVVEPLVRQKLKFLNNSIITGFVCTRYLAIWPLMYLTAGKSLNSVYKTG